MLPLQSLEAQSYEEIRDQLLAKLRERCPTWPIDDAADPARVFVELFSWLNEQSQYRLSQRSEDDLRRLYQSFGFSPRLPQGARALCQFESTNPTSSGRVIVPAGTILRGGRPQEQIQFRTTEDLTLSPSTLSAAISIVDGKVVEHELGSPWSPFQSSDPNAFELHIQDPLFEALVHEGVVGLSFVRAQDLPRAALWRWDLWVDDAWSSLTPRVRGETLLLERHPKRQLLPRPGRRGLAPSILKALDPDQWTVRASLPGKDRDILYGPVKPLLWARQSQRDWALSEQEDGEHSYLWPVERRPDQGRFSARIEALNLTDHPDLLGSLEWVGSQGRWLIASLAEDQWTVEEPGTATFQDRPDSGEWHFQWSLPEDWVDPKGSLQLTLSYDYAPDGGAFVEVLAAHAEPLPARLKASVEKISALRDAERWSFYDGVHISGDDGHGLYLGFDEWAPEQNTSVYVDLEENQDANEAAAPELHWQSWDGEAWVDIETKDQTGGLCHSGLLQWGPAISRAKEIHSQKKHWIRAVLSSGAWLLPPQIKQLKTNVVWAVEGRRIDRECLGEGDGVASLRLKLGERPVSALLDVTSTNAKGEDARWEPVHDFLDSSPSDKHFVFDLQRSELLFGDGQRGGIPESGERFFASYKVSAGIKGNVGPGALKVEPGPELVPFRGTNIHRAFGAIERENLRQVITRAKGSFQEARAITISDFERLARASSPLVEHARCFERDGVVQVCVLPRKDVPWTPALRDHVQSYLDERKILTTQCQVHGPKTMSFTLEVRIRSQEGGSPSTQNKFISALKDYFDWWSGGVEGCPWSFGARLNAADCLRFLADRSLNAGVLDLKFKEQKSPASLELCLPPDALPHCSAIKVIGID